MCIYEHVYSLIVSSRNEFLCQLEAMCSTGEEAEIEGERKLGFEREEIRKRDELGEMKKNEVRERKLLHG